MQERLLSQRYTLPPVLSSSTRQKALQRALTELKSSKALLATRAAVENSVQEQLPYSSDDEIESSSQKRCARCKQLKPVQKFARHGRSRDGRARFCRYCSLEEALQNPVDEPDVQHRTCRECGELKHVSEFTKNNANMTGLDRKCRSCTLRMMRKATQHYRQMIENNGGPLDAEKRCSLCGLVKPAERYYTSFASRSGLSSRCRDCVAAVVRGIDPEDIRGGMIVDAYKFCPRCEQTLSFKEFSKDVTARDAREPFCKQCTTKSPRRRKKPRDL